MPIPRLGVSCSSGAAFRAWVLLLPFLGAMPIPRLGVSCSSGAAFRVGVLFWPFWGRCQILAWVFLARRVLTKWMVMDQSI